MHGGSSCLDPLCIMNYKLCIVHDRRVLIFVNKWRGVGGGEVFVVNLPLVLS